MRVSSTRQSAVPLAPLQEQDWGALLFAIRNGTCILMLGPEAIQEVVQGGEPKPIMAGFAEKLKKELGVSGPEFESCFELGQEFHRKQQYDDLGAHAVSYFSEPRDIYRPPLEDLADLPFRLIVTTTPGHEMETVLKERNKPPYSAFYNFSDPKKPKELEPTVQRPLVYHLYGSVDEPRSLPLSEHDLLDFLVAVISRQPELPEWIRRQFMERRTCFLFLGFGFGHWCLRILLHAIHAPRAETRSFAIERFNYLPPESVKKVKHFFQGGHRIFFFDMDLETFTRELVSRYEPPSTSPPPPAGAPTVFISHASEDRGYAQELAGQLTKNDIRAWIDVERLQPGERWNEALQRMVLTTDYFLVLQSHNLWCKRIGYVNRELHLALGRLPEFRDTLFIIPTRIEQCELLDQFKDLQCADLYEPGGLESVIQRIRDDYAVTEPIRRQIKRDHGHV